MKDLLSLAWTGHSIRRVLVSPNAAPVWKAVRRADGILDPPLHISEARWAALWFGSVCQVRRHIVPQNSTSFKRLDRHVATKIGRSISIC